LKSTNRQYSVIVIEVADGVRRSSSSKVRVRYVSIEEEERRPEKDPDTVRQRRVIECARPEYGSVVCRRRRVQYVSIEESADQRRIGIRSTAACRVVEEPIITGLAASIVSLKGSNTAILAASVQ
jgi:hypothetical protein